MHNFIKLPYRVITNLLFCDECNAFIFAIEVVNGDACCRVVQQSMSCQVLVKPLSLKWCVAWC